MSRSIFDLTEEAQALHELLTESIDPETGEEREDTSPLLAWMEDHAQAVEAKADACAAVIREAEAHAAALKAEADRLRHRAKQHENTVARVKKLLAFLLLNHPGGKIKTAHNTFGLRKPSVSVDLMIMPEELPEAYRKTTVAANKSAILAALKAGEQIPGCALREGEAGVTIR